MNQWSPSNQPPSDLDTYTWRYLSVRKYGSRSCHTPLKKNSQVLTKSYHKCFSQKVYLLTFKMPCRPSSYDVLSRKYYILKLGDFSSFLLFSAILTLNCMFCCKKEVKIVKNTKNHLTLKNNISVIRLRMRTVDTAF